MRRLALALLLAASTLAGGCADKGVHYVGGRVEVRFWHSMTGINSIVVS